MGEVNHQRIKTNGVWLHVAEQGTGPLVLLLHGFPELWYSWRHQMKYLANQGYHAVAPDLRGYGDSDAPLCPNSYTIFHVVGDIIGLIDHFGQQKAFVVGTEWGAVFAWHLSLFRPDRVKGVVALSVPYSPRPTTTTFVETIKHTYFYQFQEAGRAERAFARYDFLTVMKKLLLMTRTEDLLPPMGMEVIDYLPTPSVLPPWITEEELMVYADKFLETGFTGPLNYFRAMDLNWELLAPWQGSKIKVPAKFVIGDKDLGFVSAGTRDYIKGDIFKSLVPNLEVVILDGHHFIHQERADQVSNEILSFIRKLTLDE